jgi:hypothetical protein
MTARIFLAAALLLMAETACAFTHTFTAGDTEITVYGPDWTWQGRDINILLIARNHGESAAAFTFTLNMPEEAARLFVYGGEMTRSLRVAPGKTARECFAGIQARTGISTDACVLRLEVADNAARAPVHIEYPVSTIRGAAVRPGVWALYLPAGIALAWCLIFFLVLRRLARPGAWRNKPDAVRETADAPPWIHDRPETGGRP